jgi:hypothetical protein
VTEVVRCADFCRGYCVIEPVEPCEDVRARGDCIRSVGVDALVSTFIHPAFA